MDNLGVVADGEVVTLTGGVATQEDCEKVALTAGNQHGIARVNCQLEIDGISIFRIVLSDSFPELANR